MNRQDDPVVQQELAREESDETTALLSAAIGEATTDLEADAQARAGVRVEEAEMWGGVDTSDAVVDEILSRAVVDLIVRDELRKKLKSGRKLRVKLGIDPTGPRLHIGRTVPLFKLRQFQRAGHQVVLIIGDFTAIVGDASDKDAQRQMLTREQIEENMATYREQVGSILDLEQVEFRHNAQWLAPLNFNDVIRLASKFTVAQMIQRENFSDRWDAGKPIGLHEILYPLMQGFDSVAIESDIEIGGTDQLFNLMAGRALQEDFGQPPQSVMTMNMIPGTDGRKMSTTWGNAIYILDEPRDMFGKLMSTTDDVMAVYLESCTTLPMSEVERVKSGIEGGSVHPMDAKKGLAWEIVRMYHGEEAANAARADFERQFQDRSVPLEVPVVPLDRAIGEKADEAGNVAITDLLINTGLAPSRKHATRLIEQGGVSVDGERITDFRQGITPAEGMVVKVGRNYVKIEG
jgi:tyrosyl-tRNA synthetase